MPQSGSAVSIRRPQRWDEPFDPTIDDSDVAYLKSCVPFAGMTRTAFPPATPLEGILRNDCRLHHVAPGELIVREGDYGDSAFLVLAGNVRVFVSHLAPEQIGRQAKRAMRWGKAVGQLLRLPRIREFRPLESVTPSTATHLQHVDDRRSVFLQDFDAVVQAHKTLELGAGDLFGEVAAMYRSPRNATVVANSEATLVEIRWQGLRLLRRDRRFADQLEQHYRAHWLKVHLRETPLFRYLPEDVLDRVASATQMQSFGRLEWNARYQKTRTLPPAEQIASEPVVASEGHLPSELILIRSGFARVSREHGAGHQTSAYLGKGQLFGLDELTHNTLRPTTEPPVPLQHSLRAVGFLDTLQIPASDFASEILPYVRQSELPPPIHRRAAKELSTTGSSCNNVKPTSDELPTGLLEFIVQHRLNNGRQAMVIDLHRCTRCDDCVTACALTHGGNPRFARTGPEHERMQFVQACMHCTDPVCMIGCPTGAIARDTQTGTISVHEPICVGCGTCANACPYQNIQMTEIRDAKGRLYRDDKTDLPILKATKCDLCQTQPSGPACIQSCPHDALERIDLGDVSHVGEYLKRRNIETK